MNPLRRTGHRILAPIDILTAVAPFLFNVSHRGIVFLEGKGLLVVLVGCFVGMNSFTKG